MRLRDSSQTFPGIPGTLSSFDRAIAFDRADEGVCLEQPQKNPFQLQGFQKGSSMVKT